eukprot:GFUD01040948.1.p1 GENE.GFUD01040948.1~~GFUD01040948.1.p1  ORF type:complete len:661 (+),score=160.23 GFUD01040948.1:435-2417(+)
MMSVKSWLILLVIYIAYLILGGFLFNRTECPAEIEGMKIAYEKDKKVAIAVIDMKTRLNEADNEVLETILSHWVDRHFFKEKNETDELCHKWNFQNSLFFSFTVVTTIGYGHQSTQTPHGRMWCIFYAIIGVPLNAILIGALGSVFSMKFKQYKHKLWEGFGKGEGVEERPRVVVVLVEGLVFVVFFSSIFLLIPAAIFTALENDETNAWDYTDSVYYTFITLSTIGFGDMVPDRQQNEKIDSEAGKMTYLVIIIIWIIFGMGYIFAVVDVISGTLKSTSKPVKKAFGALKNQMHVNDYWRKIIGEIIVLKHGDGDENGVLVGGGGGSEPCLGELEGAVNLAMRRAVSTGDIQDGVDDNDSIGGGIHMGPAPAAAKVPLARTESLKVPSPNFLAVPGGHMKTRSVSGDGEKNRFLQIDSHPSLEEMNEDTISSLRQFLTSARMNQPGVDAWVENNLPGCGGDGDSQAPTRLNSRNSSFGQNKQTKLNHVTVGGFGNTSEVTAVRRRSLQSKMNRRNSVKSTLSRQSTRSAASNGTGGPIGALLETTTLGEFLTAVENVRKKSTMEMDKLEVVVDNGGSSKPSSRRSSMVRKLSRRKGSKEVIALPQQLATLFSTGKPDNNTSDIPLMQASPSPTISEKLFHVNSKDINSRVETNGFTQHM